MANVFLLGQGKTEVGRHPNPPEYMGKFRVVGGSFTTAAASTGPGTGPINSGDFIIVGLLPKDSMVMAGGLITFGAMGGAATVTVGTYTRLGNVFTAVAASRYLGSTSVVAAGAAALANTDALNFMDIQSQDVYLVLTAGGNAYANGQTIKISLPIVAD